MQFRPDSPIPVSSSLAPVLEPEQQSLYQGVLKTLNEHAIPYAVSGAFALQRHTRIWRVTKDLDLFLTAEALAPAMELLRKKGFYCVMTDPVWLAKAHRGPFFVDLITGMSNAALVVTDSWMAHAQPAPVLDVASRVLAAEELLVSKLFVIRRERFDGADIAHIVYGTRGQLDWERVLALVGDHWELLLWALLLFRYVYPLQTEFVPLPLWAELLRRLVPELLQPNPSARFRGSLVDDNMFAIDVNEWGLEDLLTQYRSRRLREIGQAALTPDCFAEKDENKP